MADVQEIVCPVCGAKNKPDTERCTSCGARLERLSSVGLSQEELYADRYQQHGFVWKWVFTSFGIYMALQVVTLMILPLVISTYDPQGLAGLAISAAVWFVGGGIVGFISPGKTFFEPVVGAMLAVGPTIVYLIQVSEVYPITLLSAVVSAALGVMITLFGAFIGEYAQRQQAGVA
ncbi:MAG: zinc ribbon domain-containing protein [Polyangiales bacterium]